jgi:hypothetical protein
MRLRWKLVGVATTLVVVTSTAWASAVVGSGDDLPGPDDPCSSNILIPYVAAGDGVVHGDKDLNGGNAVGESDRYSEVLTKKLVDAHFPYCLFNVSQGSTTTDDYQDEDIDGFTQQSKAHDLRPRLITLELGRENDSIKNHISTCLDQIKDHLFIQANACALAVLADQGAFEKLTKDLSDILNQYKVQMDGNPRLVIAVLGYFNPYPAATDVVTKIPEFCTKLVDVIPTCTIHWALLSPVLVILDQIVKKLNTTIEDVVKKFAIASQGRYYFVNPYDKFKSHCMKMEVEINIKVYHPTNTVDSHQTKKDFGCSEPWIESDGFDGKLPPWHYLPPAVNGVLVYTDQTTSGMGAFPNKDGHKCLADLIYEADNGWGLLKNRLDIPEPAGTPCD